MEQVKDFGVSRGRVVGDLLLRWSGVAVFLLLWEAAPRIGWADPRFAPPFSEVLRSTWGMLLDGSFGSHLLVSLWRALVGLLAASVIGIPAGILLARLPRTAESFDPLLRILSQANPFALLPVFMFFFGIGETNKIAVVAWVALWPIIYYTLGGIRTVEPALVVTGRSLGLDGMTLTLRVLLPAALPTLFVGVRIGAGLVFFMLVAAEMLGASAGLGALVHNSAMNYQIPRMYAGTAAIIVLGYLFACGLRHLEANLFAGQLPSAAPSRSRRSLRRGRIEAAITAVVLLGVLGGGAFEVRRVNERNRTSGHAERHHHHHSHGLHGSAPAEPEDIEALEELFR